MGRISILAFCALLPALSGAHDVWIQPGARAVRTGDWLSLSLMLGNHGDEHRDFRLASKVAAADRSLRVIGPLGAAVDLSKSLVDAGQHGFGGVLGWAVSCRPLRGCTRR